MDWEERIKSIFTEEIIIYAENLKELTKTQPELISHYNKVAGYKINKHKSITFLYTSNEQVEFKIKNTILFTLLAPKKWNT